MEMTKLMILLVLLVLLGVVGRLLLTQYQKKTMAELMVTPSQEQPEPLKASVTPAARFGQLKKTTVAKGMQFFSLAQEVDPEQEILEHATMGPSSLVIFNPDDPQSLFVEVSEVSLPILVGRYPEADKCSELINDLVSLDEYCVSHEDYCFSRNQFILQQHLNQQQEWEYQIKNVSEVGIEVLEAERLLLKQNSAYFSRGIDLKLGNQLHLVVCTRQKYDEFQRDLIPPPSSTPLEEERLMEEPTKLV